MRFVVTMLLWLVTTAALAVAVPTVWAQKTVVNEDGYAALAQKAARDPQLQDAMASELTTQVTALATKRGYPLDAGVVGGVANAYTVSSSFPGQFAQANRVVHRWAFDDPASDSRGHWQLDLAPMLSDTSLQQTLSRFGVAVPSSLTVPVTVNAPDSLRPGQLRDAARFGPWVAIGASVLTGVFALLTLAVARRRGKALASLGVSALLVGAAGWAAPEIGRRYITAALNRTSGDIRTIADVMVANAEASLHQWLNLTLAAGGALVVFGVIVTMLAGLRRS
ncbi:MAG: hypothetical protein JO152_16360 [Mycobacteriaceae bacterium]|nr:hypothetical protein [Mycobacteriaceae bacterium]